MNTYDAYVWLLCWAGMLPHQSVAMFYCGMVHGMSMSMSYVSWHSRVCMCSS